MQHFIKINNTWNWFRSAYLCFS